MKKTKNSFVTNFWNYSMEIWIWWSNTINFVNHLRRKMLNPTIFLNLLVNFFTRNSTNIFSIWLFWFRISINKMTCGRFGKTTIQLQHPIGRKKRPSMINDEFLNVNIVANWFLMKISTNIKVITRISMQIFRRYLQPASRSVEEKEERKTNDFLIDLVVMPFYGNIT